MVCIELAKVPRGKTLTKARDGDIITKNRKTDDEE